MIHGSCACKGARFELDDTIDFINHCHCSICRKTSGAEFGTFAHARASGFRYSQGEELVVYYASSPAARRAFCRVCGSCMPVVYAEQNHVVIPAGTLDDDPGVRPSVHIFTGSKAPWVEIADALTKYEAWPPGVAPPERASS